MRISTAYSAAIVVPMLIATQLQAGSVISDWNTIASTAIVKTAGVGPAASAVYFTYASLAAYDAVNAITGQYTTVANISCGDNTDQRGDSV